MNNPQQKTILLVEDETVTMMVETHLIKSFGYDVVPAKSGEEAVKIATGNDKIALILMDVNLGAGIDGPEAARQILAKRNLPVVFLSAHTDKEYVERIKGIAGYGYVVKNSSNIVLQSSIEMALNLFEVQEAMREREALHLNLLAKLPAGIIIIDPLTRTIESVNARAAAMFGVAAEQIVGHRCHAFLCPAQDKNCPVLDLGQEVDYSERMMLHADGSRHPVLKSVTRIQLCGQEKLLECFVDITERKKTEEALRLFKDSVEHSSDAIGMSTPDGRHYYQNEAFNCLFGDVGDCPPETLYVDQAIGKQVFDTIMGGGSWQGEIKMFKKDRTILDILLRAYAIQNQDGRIIGLVGLHTDITMRKRAEEALRASERSLAITFSSIGDAVIATDAQGRIVRMNRVAEQLTGWPLKEALGRPLDEVFHIINQHTRLPLENPVSKVLETGKIQGLANDTVLVSRQGVECVIADSAAAIMDDQTGQAVGVVLVFRDQTREHAAAEALRESEEKSKAIANYTVNWESWFGPDGKYLWVNPAVENFTGYSAPEILAMPDFSSTVIAEEDRARFAARMHEALSDSRGENFEFRYLHKNGTKRWLSASYQPIFDAKGNSLGTRASGNDITERKKAEAEREIALKWQQNTNMLRQSLLAPAMLEHKMNVITDGIARVFDADFCRIWLIRPGDLCEKGCIHAEAKKGPHVCRYQDKCLHLMASSGRYTHIDGKGHARVPFGCYKIGIIASGEEHKFLTNDVANDPRVHNREWARELGLVSFAGYQLKIPGGETIGVLALFAKHPILPVEDAILDSLGTTAAFVVQQAAMDEALRRSEEKYRSLFESSRDAIMTLEPPSWRFTTGNPAAIEMFKAKNEDEFVSCEPWKLSPQRQPDGRASDEKAKEMIEKAMREGSNFFEWTHKRISGEEFPATVLLSRMEQDEKTFLQATVSDITERKEMQEKLLVSEKLIVMGRMVADVSHELNNPLAIIAGNTSLLEKMAKERVTTIPDSENAKRFEKIQKAINRCKIIMASLLVSTRPTILDIKPTDMNKIIEESLESMDDRLKSQKIKVVKAFTPRLPIIDADGHRLGQVFINMFSNACDAMPEGGELRIATRLHTPGKATGKEGPAIEIEISDTGEGIGEDDLFKIFDPFVTTKIDGKGVGLGLSISSGIVREHGGDISVTSKKGKGATFIIKIPYRT